MKAIKVTNICHFDISGSYEKGAAFFSYNAYKGCPNFVPILLPSITFAKLPILLKAFTI